MAMSQKELDIQMMLAAKVHLGTKNCDFQMERYVWKRGADGIFIFNLSKTWDKLQMAARVIVAIENPQDICVQSARPYGQRAVLKFAQYTGAHAIAGRHTPGTFTNQLQNNFSEPRLLILTDPRVDHQPANEAALGNIPTIAFCDTDSPMRYVDIGIPANNKGKHSIGCLYWLLSRMVLQMRGTVTPTQPWDVMVDLFFYREPEDVKDREEEEVVPGAGGEFGVPDFGGAAAPGAVGLVPPALSDAQWDAAPTAGGEWEAAAAAPPAAVGAEWATGPVPGPIGGVSWEATAAPVPAAAAIVPSGWEGAAAPGAAPPPAGGGSWDAPATAGWETAPPQ
eukprot:TRINITY_DN132_c0_g1_i5.p1 TRINITY_DN132_c0_g1~~TRINITY_DN132_c0_g1_i5.p1  ORF type:complete len:337 (+),score=110.59 TRINITY_DN132_c0_g1_i5:185-1195(+)